MKSCCICQGYINLSKSVGKSKERGKKTIMENTNEMKIIFDSRPENEGLARVAAAAFCTQLNPTLEEVADLKTAVSEAGRSRRTWKASFYSD